MNETAVERRLAAILAADVVGYSRLMGADEVGTLRALRAHRRQLIDPAIAERCGRIVKRTGDGLLPEFPSAVQAVACAITIQRGLASRNKSTAEEKRLTFRKPGAICISRAVRDQVRDKLPVAFDDLREVIR